MRLCHKPGSSTGFLYRTRSRSGRQRPVVFSADGTLSTHPTSRFRQLTRSVSQAPTADGHWAAYNTSIRLADYRIYGRTGASQLMRPGRSAGTEIRRG